MECRIRSNPRQSQHLPIFTRITHPNHLILPGTISASASPSSSPKALFFIRDGAWLAVTSLLCTRCPSRSPAKRYWPQFSILTNPDAQKGHERRARDLQGPPGQRRGHGARVERRRHKMEEGDRAGEVRDELGARDEQKEVYDAVPIKRQLAFGAHT